MKKYSEIIEQIADEFVEENSSNINENETRSEIVEAFADLMVVLEKFECGSEEEEEDEDDMNEGEKTDSQYYLELNISNIEDLYEDAMECKTGAELKSLITKNKSKLPDIKSIDFKEVNWDEALKDLKDE